MKRFSKQRGFAVLIILIAFVLLISIACVAFYFLMNRTGIFQKEKTSSPATQTSSSPSTSPSTSTAASSAKIMSIYELNNSVFFTTDKTVNAKFYHWLDPKFKTESYLGNGVVFNLSGSTLKKGMGYQIKITDEKGSEVVSDSYAFEGDKTILADSRCPKITLDYIETNLYAICQKSSACVQNSDALSCPLDKINATVKSADIKAAWTDNDISYSLSKVYLTSDIVDLGDYKNNPGIKGKYFLAMEVKVRDLRTDGQRRVIGLENYFRLRREKEDSTPIPLQPNALSPQENGTLYVLFAVDKEEAVFNLLVGVLKNPNVIRVDFSNVSGVSGTFSYKDGFSSN